MKDRFDDIKTEEKWRQRLKSMVAMGPEFFRDTARLVRTL